MIKKILMRNYRIYEKFDLELNSGLNIIVGDNDCGKSTLLESVSLALTGHLHGKLLAQELSLYLFNDRAIQKCLDELLTGRTPPPLRSSSTFFLTTRLHQLRSKARTISSAKTPPEFVFE